MTSKSAVPPLIPSSKNYQSLRVCGNIRSGSPVLNWNQTYNNNNNLVLGPSTQGNYVIDFNRTPFNYIRVETNEPSPQIIEIKNCPPTWFYLNNRSTVDITISPQTNGSPNFDPTNNYTIPMNTYNIISVNPGVPPLNSSMQTVSRIEMLV